MRIILIEPFYAGSHKQLIDLIYEELSKHHHHHHQTSACTSEKRSESEDLLLLERVDLGNSCPAGHYEEEPMEIMEVHLATMTGKKWHWRARTSALHFSQTIPKKPSETKTVIFASSTLPLHELIALRPDLSSAYKIIYFHENQLVYPVRKQQERDFQFGYNQVLTCLVADKILFNSRFNMDSFLLNIKPYFKLQPDYRPKNLVDQIQPKSSVLYFPIQTEHLDKILHNPVNTTSSEVFKIVWPHRWEFDKNPEMFFRAMTQLITENVTNFKIYLLGEGFTDNPEVFSLIGDNSLLKPHIAHTGYLPSKEEYFKTLQNCDIVISSAIHEFFGVAMLEAVYSGCYPLCPNSLVYPEIFGSSEPECLYNNETELLNKLKGILTNPVKSLKRSHENLMSRMEFKNRFDWETLKPNYMTLFEEL